MWNLAAPYSSREGSSCPSLKRPYNVSFASSNSKDLKELDEGLGETGLGSKARIRKTRNSLVLKVHMFSRRGSVTATLGGDEK